MRRKNNVKYYFAMNRHNSASSFLFADYSKIVPKKYEETIATFTHPKGKKVKTQVNESHFPPCDRKVVDEIIKELFIF